LKSSDYEHSVSLILNFLKKSDDYLVDQELKFSDEKLAAMFKLFEVLVECQGEFGRLNPNHFDSSKLGIQASLIVCYEARGFLDNVKDTGIVC